VFVANEQRCPFIAVAIDVPPQQADVWLLLIGSAAVRAFLQTEFWR
jgi:hypothetical protein